MLGLVDSLGDYVGKSPGKHRESLEPQEMHSKHLDM